MKSFDATSKKSNGSYLGCFIVLLVYLIPILIAFSIKIFVNPGEEGNGINDYARITDVEYKAELLDEPDSGGKVLITEKLTYDIHAKSKDNLFYEQLII